MTTAAALPPIVVTLAIGLFALAESFGYTPLSYGPPVNVAEAAGMGSATEVVRLLQRGGDPNRLDYVRPQIISSSVTRVTALEAAIWSRRVELVRLLDTRGAIADDASRHHLACLAADINARDIVQYLAPNGAACEPQAEAKAVVARSRR
jgi:hypothetical protein